MGKFKLRNNDSFTFTKIFKTKISRGSCVKVILTLLLWLSASHLLLGNQQRGSNLLPDGNKHTIEISIESQTYNNVFFRSTDNSIIVSVNAKNNKGDLVFYHVKKQVKTIYPEIDFDSIRFSQSHFSFISIDTQTQNYYLTITNYNGAMKAKFLLDERPDTYQFIYNRTTLNFYLYAQYKNTQEGMNDYFKIIYLKKNKLIHQVDDITHFYLFSDSNAMLVQKKQYYSLIKINYNPLSKIILGSNFYKIHPLSFPKIAKFSYINLFAILGKRTKTSAYQLFVCQKNNSCNKVIDASTYGFKKDYILNENTSIKLIPELRMFTLKIEQHADNKEDIKTPLIAVYPFSRFKKVITLDSNLQKEKVNYSFAEKRGSNFMIKYKLDSSNMIENIKLLSTIDGSERNIPLKNAQKVIFSNQYLLWIDQKEKSLNFYDYLKNKNQTYPLSLNNINESISINQLKEFETNKEHSKYLISTENRKTILEATFNEKKPEKTRIKSFTLYAKEPRVPNFFTSIKNKNTNSLYIYFKENDFNFNLEHYDFNLQKKQTLSLPQNSSRHLIGSISMAKKETLFALSYLETGAYTFYILKDANGRKLFTPLFTHKIAN